METGMTTLLGRFEAEMARMSEDRRMEALTAHGEGSDDRQGIFDRSRARYADKSLIAEKRGFSDDQTPTGDFPDHPRVVPHQKEDNKQDPPAVENADKRKHIKKNTVFDAIEESENGGSRGKIQ